MWKLGQPYNRFLPHFNSTLPSSVLACFKSNNTYKGPQKLTKNPIRYHQLKIINYTLYFDMVTNFIFCFNDCHNDLMINPQTNDLVEFFPNSNQRYPKIPKEIRSGYPVSPYQVCISLGPCPKNH